MANEGFGVVIFHTSSSALKAEKTLFKGGLKVKLIPTPREFSSDCGMALRFDWPQEVQVRLLLASALVESAAIHRLA
jgi:hypothetical protein